MVMVTFSKTKIETKPKSIKVVDRVHANTFEGGC
jgi:hypothetical protein